MVRVRLVKPRLFHEKAVMAFKREFEQNQDPLYGTGMLDKFATYQEWLAFIKSCERAETVPPGFVLADTYLCFHNFHLVGMVNIRHYLNDELFACGGHVGYCVRKSKRLKGYATEILALALEKCRALSIEKVLVTCDYANIGSARVIEHNGGKLENIIEENGLKIKRYWVDLLEVNSWKRKKLKPC